MGEIYLIRHGQAGTRLDYDRLSDLGRHQARLLGRYFLRHGIHFDRVISGALQRQRQTAAALGAPATADPRWNEFDLDAVYAEIGPRLAAVDDAFRDEYAQVQQLSTDASHAVHRQWRPGDIAVVSAWVAGRFPTQTESWQAFQQRITDAFSDVPPQGRLALVSSATPIGIVTSRLLESPEHKALELAGSLYNASFTVLRWRNGGWRLAGFNHIPHLPEESLRTHR